MLCEVRTRFDMLGEVRPGYVRLGQVSPGLVCWELLGHIRSY